VTKDVKTEYSKIGKNSEIKMHYSSEQDNISNSDEGVSSIESDSIDCNDYNMIINKAKNVNVKKRKAQRAKPK
jgi:hypothetical protein